MKTVEFSETVAACDLKVGRCRQLIKIMKVCEKRRSRSFLYHIFSKFCALLGQEGERLQAIGPLVNWIFFILAGIEDMHESLDEFEFRPICNRVMALDCC